MLDSITSQRVDLSFDTAFVAQAYKSTSGEQTMTEISNIV